MTKKKGILFIHGIQEKPEIFAPYLPLIPESWQSECILLQGHKASLKEFSQASMKIWKKQVADAVAKMRKTNDTVILVGHSMGTLLALEQAEHADALFLLNTPLTIRITPDFLKMSLKKVIHAWNPSSPYETAAFRSWSVTSDKRIWYYVPFCMRYLELFYEMYTIRKKLKNITTPIKAFFGQRDEMVSPKSAKPLRRVPEAEIFLLNNSGHFYYPLAEQNLLLNQFRALLEHFDRI